MKLSLAVKSLLLVLSILATTAPHCQENDINRGLGSLENGEMSKKRRASLPMETTSPTDSIEKDGLTNASEAHIKDIKRKAASGDSDAQYTLGMFYYDYDDTKNSIYKMNAVKQWTKAAIQQNAQAQYSLALCYYYGHGVPQNQNETLKWLRLAANQGQADAQYELGMLFYKGDTLLKDKFRAAELWTRAANQGHANAQYELGRCFTGNGNFKPDYDEAIKLFRSAAEQGHEDALLALG